MTAISEVEGVVSIMQRYRMKRLRWMKDNKSMAEEELPGSLSRESEALAIMTFVRSGQDKTADFIGHHP